MADGSKECIFCGIIRGVIKAKKVYHDKWTTAFLDINPRNPGHTVVATNNHYETIMNIPRGEACHLFQTVRRVSIGILRGIGADGVSIIQSSGASAGQVIKHMKFHVIPRFSSEDPVSLEGILPVKRVSEGQKDEIVKKIRSKIPK
jgi:histidine triad (HIT) family protein